MTEQSPADVFIVDNSNKRFKVLDYLAAWVDIAQSLDIATGYFEIGALRELEGKWQQFNPIRILLGDQVTRSTRDALLAGLPPAVECGTCILFVSLGIMPRSGGVFPFSF